MTEDDTEGRRRGVDGVITALEEGLPSTEDLTEGPGAVGTTAAWLSRTTNRLVAAAAVRWWPTRRLLGSASRAQAELASLFVTDRTRWGRTDTSEGSGSEPTRSGVTDRPVAADRAVPHLDVTVLPVPGGATVTVANIAPESVEIRDVGSRGDYVDVLTGRPVLAPGQALERRPITGDRIALQAFEPGTDRPLGSRVERRVDRWW